SPTASVSCVSSVTRGAGPTGPSGPNSFRICSSVRNSVCAPSASPIARPKRQPWIFANRDIADRDGNASRALVHGVARAVTSDKNRNGDVHSYSIPQTQGLAAPRTPARSICGKLPPASLPAALLREDSGTVLVGELL